MALKQAFPESKITWAVDPRFAGIIECCSSVDEIQRVKTGFKPASWPSFDTKFELALDMQGLSKSGLVVARAKADKKLGYHWQRELAPLFSAAVMPDASSLHVVDQYVDVARAAGAECDRAEFGMAPLEEDRDKCKSLLAEHGVEGPFVVMNAGAGWASKRWPSLHFSRLSDMISAKGISPVFIGGKAEGDQQAFREVEQEAKSGVVNLLGKTSVRELVSLISLANAHVGGDTGSSHVAAALGVPAVGLYSITKPVRSCPYGQIHRCHYAERKLGDIEPETVFRTVWEAVS
ncbi:MAG: glycosyltransferase family 9 protein [Armatimonadota bacterium]